jgi:hypothetical protein
MLGLNNKWLAMERYDWIKTNDLIMATIKGAISSDHLCPFVFTG